MKLLKKLSCWIFKTHEFIEKPLWDSCIWCGEVRERINLISSPGFLDGDNVLIWKNKWYKEKVSSPAPKHRQVAKQPKLSLNKKTSKGVKTI